MIFYYFLLLVPCIFSITSISKNKKNSSFFIFSYLIIITLVFGLRNNIGGDWINYYIFYETINDNFHPINFKFLENDYLFDLINWFSFNLSLGFHFVNLINYIIFTFCLGIFITQYKNSTTVLVIAMPYLIIVASTGYIRQISAFALFLISILFLVKEKYFRFILFLTLGALFHKTIFLMSVLFPIAAFDFKKNIRFKFNIQSVAILIILITFSIIFYYYYLRFKFSFMFYYYLGEGMFFSSQGAIYRFIPFFISAILFILFFKKLNLNRIETNIYLFFSIFILICAPLILNYSTAIDRILIYFYPIQFLIFSQFHIIFDDKRNRIFYNILISVFSLFQLIVWGMFGQHSKHWLNYKNIILDYML